VALAVCSEADAFVAASQRRAGRAVAAVNDRRTQAAMLALVGATALWLGLTDAALCYVRGSPRPPVASGVALLVLLPVTPPAPGSGARPIPASTTSTASGPAVGPCCNLMQLHC
jgi:hypothetical protein